MNSIFNDDKYKALHYNSSTGEQDRLWIRYGDNTFEPVRRDGNLNRKSRNKPAAPDWWVTDRPQGWDPAKHGHKVTLNHDYGAGRKPGQGGASPTSGKSTIASGGEGFWEYEARQKASEADKSTGEPSAKPRNSAQDARELRQREREEHGKEPLPAPSKEKRSNAIKEFLTPPLLLPDGNPKKKWAKEVIKHHAEEWGKTMLHGGHPIQGVIEWIGDDNATLKDFPRAIGKSVWF